MDFDINDPLGDILSDDSNDSFFNDDKYKSKSKTKSSPVADIAAKKSNLFGLDSAVKEPDVTANVFQPKKSGGDWLGLNDSKPATPIIERKPSFDLKKASKPNIQPSGDVKKAATMFSDDLNFLDDLGLGDVKLNTENVKSVTKPPKSMLSLDDLLGKSSTEQVKKNETPYIKKDNIQGVKSGYDPTASSSAVKIDTKKPILIPKEPREKLRENITQPVKNEKKDVLNTRRQKSNKDWLGLFPDESDDILKAEDTDKKKSLTDLLKQDKVDDVVPKTKDENKPQVVKESTPNEHIIERDEKSSDLKSKEVFQMNQLQIDMTNLITKPIILPNLKNNPITNLSDNVNIEQQSAALCLQQQESHLMVALQLKAQEERLSAMHDRQEETRRVQRQVVSAHREQLDHILHGQAEHRSQLQDIITQHQYRINKHIQSLLRPPGSPNEQEASQRPQFVGSYNQAVSNNKIIDKNYGIDESKREQERVQLEQIITLLKESHEKEIDIIESSYKRQLLLVNESLTLIEERLKVENEKLSQYYSVKINKLEEENIKISEQFELLIKTIEERHEIEKKRIETKHLDDIEILQNQHKVVINNIRDTIALEKTTIKDTRDYSDKLQSIMIDVEKNNGMCVNIMEKLDHLSSNEIDVRHKALQTKEEQINRILDTLEKQSGIYEVEALQTKNMLQAFEKRLMQQTQILEDEKSLLKERRHSLEVENERLKKEYDSLKKQLELEKELFKQNSLHIDKTNDEIKSNIEEQHKKLEMELYTLKNEKKLILDMKSEYITSKSKLDEEMQDLNDKKKELQNEQNKLYHQEIKMLERSRELEMLTRTALAKQKNADNKMSEASYAQQKYEEKMSKIQEHSISLNAREQQIARDKVSLSRERLLLYNQRTENDYALCSVCKSTSLPKRLVQLRGENHSRLGEQNTESRLNFHSYNDYLDIDVTRDVTNEDMVVNNADMYSHRLEELKDLKEDFNTLEQITHVQDQDFLNSFKTDFNEKLPNVFQDIVDPKIIAMKFDIRSFK